MIIGRLFRAGLGLLLVAAVTDPALAQRTGSRMGRDAGTNDVPKAMRIMAECMAGKRRNMLRQWFDTLPGTAEEDRIFDRELGDMGLCLEDRMLVVDGKTIVVTARMVRYPLALAKARRELRLGGVVPAMNKDQSWFAPRLASLAAGAPVDRVALDL
jgi:hypothetical protein